MNLDSCTKGQRASIEHVEGPLLVSAGAGSGKTFTLTQRIAYALLPESGPAVGSIDEVLAITFTEKAAAEIKARVKRTLRAEGMTEEALRVDAAWISTIHGMCARILRTHALELGLDPAFGILSEAERSDLIALAIDDALGKDNDIISRGSYAALFDEYPARSSQSSVTSVASMLHTLIGKAAGLRGGIDAIDFGPAPERASSLARTLLLAYEEVQPAIESGGKTASALRACEQAMESVDLLSAFLSVDENALPLGGEREAARAHQQMVAFAEVLERCPLIPRTFGNAEVKAEVKSYQAIHKHVCRCVVLALAYPRTGELVSLAREVIDGYEKKKRGACKLDNDDLLVKTLQAFEQCPAIALHYEQQFKLVMVDEFQDTSQLQIDMIGRLAGSGYAHLCTVGDAQQSIYRFRGADVNVYNAHKRTMRSVEVSALYVELAKNFRSHGDVLSFVDRVFEQPSVFGDDFMSLEPNSLRPSSWRGAGSRIDLVMASRPSVKGSGISVEDAKRTCARAIAERFSALRACGHASRDMVVLLGNMTRAEVYAQALREEGFECAVTGGSLFARASEVHVVVRLVEALANPANTAALFEVLTSEMVCLSTDDLLELSTIEDPETKELRRCDLDRGFTQLLDCEEDLPLRLAFAVRLFNRAQTSLRTNSVAQVITDTIVRSGWMVRLQAEGAVGLACAANILKTIRLVEQLEHEGHTGIASTARALSSIIKAGVKEAPGALSGSDGDVVKIMTIHASKGLEFPIVALADFASSGFSPGKLVVETGGSVAWASLSAGCSLESLPSIKKHAGSKVDEEENEGAEVLEVSRLFEEVVSGNSAQAASSYTQDAFRLALSARGAKEDLAEARRKLYVGLTRASEALVVAMEVKEPAAGKPVVYPTLVDDIRSALCGSSDFPEGEGLLEFGGSEPARFQRIVVASSQESVVLSSVEENIGKSSPFFVPCMEDVECVSRSQWQGFRSDVFSYTSIAPSDKRNTSVKSCREHVPEAVISLDSLPVEASAIGRFEGVVVSSPCARVHRATDLGSAFHRVAQLSTETGQPPSKEVLTSFAVLFDLSLEQKNRFDIVCRRWYASDLYAEALCWERCQAEVPFFVPFEDEYLEGEIDLLCTTAAVLQGSRAFVVDYKTGGNNNTSEEALFEKHYLQAACYAYALLLQGVVEVELHFVYVEHIKKDTRDEPAVIDYCFSRSSLPELRAKISSSRITL